MKWNLIEFDKKRLGGKGENLAAGYLKRQGYTILERNYRNKSGEIDIIARDKGRIVFLEVKTRTNDNMELLTASINRNKRKRLVKLAADYLSTKHPQYSGIRFDVVFVISAVNGYKLDHFKNAFTLDDF